MTDPDSREPISEEERRRRRAVVNSTLGTLRIEALGFSKEALALCESFVEGELSLDELTLRIRQLHHQG